MIVNLYSLYASETTANYLTIGYLYAAAYYIYVYSQLQNYYYYLVFEKCLWINLKYNLAI